MEECYYAPPLVFFTFFKLYKWYQIAQSITYLISPESQKVRNENAFKLYTKSYGESYETKFSMKVKTSSRDFQKLTDLEEIRNLL